MEGRPPPVHHPHRAVAAGHRGRDRTEADWCDPDHPVSLPRQQDPHPLGHATHLTADTVESPLRREAHGGFGERSGETDREQSRHRAPGLLSVDTTTERTIRYRPCHIRPRTGMAKDAPRVTPG